MTRISHRSLGRLMIPIETQKVGGRGLERFPAFWMGEEEGRSLVASLIKVFTFQVLFNRTM